MEEETSQRSVAHVVAKLGFENVKLPSSARGERAVHAAGITLAPVTV